MSWNLGIDIGGTNVKIGVANDAGEVLDRMTLSTEGAEDPGRFVSHLHGQARGLLQRNGLAPESLEFIGVGVPGTVEQATGFVRFCPNIPWVDIPLGELMGQAFGRRVHIEQDVRLAALAEMLFGAGRGYTDILCVVVGTGIGAGIIKEGALLRGALNTAGEMGHMIIEKNGRRCACGQEGCLERYASGAGIAQRASEVLGEGDLGGRTPTAKTVFSLAQEGNQAALKVVDESVEYLALGIANAVNLLAPQAVIVGGGVAQSGGLFFEPLRKYVYRYGFYSWAKQKKLRIHEAGLGSDAAMIGAAVLCRGQ